jgi:hypothetical protein
MRQLTRAPFGTSAERRHCNAIASRRQIATAVAAVSP